MNPLSILNNWKRVLLIVNIPAIVWIGIIYITFGSVFDPVFSEEATIVEIFNFPTQIAVFDSDISIPTVVKSIGHLSVMLLTIGFVLWLLSFTVLSYLRLSKQLPGKIELLIELLIITILYYFIVTPSNIIIALLGWSVLVLNFALITFYWIYQIQTKR